MGKVIGGLLGLLTGGLIGALIGLFFGHMFDQAKKRFIHSESPEALQAIQTTFFRTTFTLIGYLAKSDGRVSEEEIDQTQQLMGKMGLTADHKREAIRLFKIGAAPDFNPADTLRDFQEVCGRRPQLTQMLMVYLVNTALADGDFDPKEEAALRNIAEGLRFSHAAFEHLIRMIRGQGAFGGGYQQSGQVDTQTDIDNAYDALGVDKQASNAEVKKAYRKLMSEYHPDKLIGQGVPDDMVKVATERSQEVQAAYDLIKKSRK
ncbi:co-chaperone DjlA [Eionea flava]